MNSHGDETGILDILEIKFFAANHGTDFSVILFKLPLWILHFDVVITLTFSRKEQ